MNENALKGGVHGTRPLAHDAFARARNHSVQSGPTADGRVVFGDLARDDGPARIR